MTRPWTEAETRQLRASAKKKFSAEPVKKKARELGLIPLKKVKAKPHRD
jgi:hypothetical protein